MKVHRVVAGAALLLAAGAASSQAAFQVILGEDFNNVAIVRNTDANPQDVIIRGVLGTDPISGIQTICYSLAGVNGLPGPVSGDVLILEPGTSGELSDVLRFIGGSLCVFSDLETGEPANPPDVGFPTIFQDNQVTVTEIGMEGGLNGVIYTALPNGPGGGGNVGITYTFISDATLPEPSTIAMAAIGASLLGLRGLSRARKARRI